MEKPEYIDLGEFIEQHSPENYRHLTAAEAETIELTRKLVPIEAVITILGCRMCSAVLGENPSRRTGHR